MGNRKTTNQYYGVRIASKSSIEIDFYYQGSRYRERIKGEPTSVNLRKAAAFRDEIIESIKDGSFDYGTTFPDSKYAKIVTEQQLTVKDFLENWLEDQIKYIKASTYRGYEKIIRNQLIPGLGPIPLSLLKLKDVKDFASKLTGDDKTIRNIISPLRCALREAVEDELIDQNPLENWRPRARKQIINGIGVNNEAESIDPFTHDEREKILSSLAGQAQNFVRFAFWTGLRTSEMVALNWDDIDFKKGTIRVVKALTQASEKPEDTKTPAGKRFVKLLPEALKALNNQKQYTLLNGAEIFQNPQTGERWTGDQPIRRTMWMPALKRAGVRYRYPYQTRHSYASMMLTAGERIQWVSKQLGHTDWSFTARTYARYIEEDDLGAGTKAVEAHHKRKQPSRHHSDGNNHTP